LATLAFSGVLHARESAKPKVAVAPADTTFSQCRRFFPDQRILPVVPEKPQLRSLCFDAYAVLHSGATHTPVFSVERLTKAQLTDAKDEERTNRFYPEARLPMLDRAQLEDYKGSGFDRGHMAPAADMPTPQAMAQSFSLANMVPQAPENNRKTWAGIEKDTRAYAKRSRRGVHVYSGPVFSGVVRAIGESHVRVPSHLFKLIYDPATGRAWAHWVENTDAAQAGRPISYAELVRRTGIEFLPGVKVAD
jgi:endonuclease G